MRCRFGEGDLYLMNEVVVVHRDTIPNGVKVASHVQTMNRYKIEKKSFSIIAPAKERTVIKISHGSHRFQYEYRKDGPAQLIHSGLVSNVFIPENCILIIDENLLHTGSESMTSGYAHLYSVRGIFLIFTIRIKNSKKILCTGISMYVQKIVHSVTINDLLI